MSTRARTRNTKQIAAAVFLLCVSATAWAQISPGPLSRSHAHLVGVTHCTDCHRATRTEFACLDCHKEIGGRVAGGRGFHAAVLNGVVSSRECRRCHSEHKGVDTPLIRKSSLEGFDHSKTGYTLQGKHATLACQKCHTPEHISPADNGDIKIKDLTRTYLGLRRACLTCHADKHRGQFKRECLDCHTYREWKNPPGFDHDKTKFRRTGEHAKVACQKCHTPANGTVQYAGLAFAKCNDCHRDPHRAVFPHACDSCHNTGSWKRADYADKFNHARAQFQLRGKHLEVDCLKCHAGGDFKRKIAFAKCTDCHKPDPHSGQFAKRADRGECSACHTVDGFKAVRFTPREHSGTAFPLEGKHAAVACAKCHAPAGKATLFRLKFAQCTDCHKDSHQTQFAAAPYANRCNECHTVQGYRPSLFTVTRHEETRFALTGGHVSVECGKCHKADAGQPPSAAGSPARADVARDGVQAAGSPARAAVARDGVQALRFRFDDRSCTTCHADPHRGQFRRLVMQVRKDGTPVGCQLCHVTKAWKDVRFSHAVEGFPLVGKHGATACIKCHKPARMEIPLKEVDFQSAPKQCEKCHQEIHLGQFARADGTTLCGDCHNPVRWKPPAFDHDRRTSFPLPGKHRTVKCADCHKNVKLVQGKPVTVFKPTPKECAACHRKPV